jgi:hypothetical protein
MKVLTGFGDIRKFKTGKEMVDFFGNENLP